MHEVLGHQGLSFSYLSFLGFSNLTFERAASVPSVNTSLKLFPGLVGEVGQWLTALAALVDELGLLSNTHNVTHKHP